MNILLTGSQGFIGKNVIHMMSDHHFFPYDKIQSLKDLKTYILKADAIIHLAGTNRSQHPSDFTQNNVDLTKTLIDLLIECNKDIPIIFSSSIQVELDNIYGKTKKDAEDLLIEYAKKYKKTVYILRLPNVFGKWAKPFYNSVVATFCHQLTHHEPIEIHDPHKELELLYIDDLIQEIKYLLSLPLSHQAKIITSFLTYKITLSDLANKLKKTIDIRSTYFIPYDDHIFDRKLHATLMSYYDPHHLNYELIKKEDERGYLSELIKESQFGQIFISKTKPGITRGNHYHHSKVEKFIVIHGEAIIKFRHIESHEVIEYKVSGEKIQVLDIIPGYTHSITNIGNDTLITLFWANEIFDPNQADTYFMEV